MPLEHDILDICWEVQLGERDAAEAIGEIDKLLRDYLAAVQPMRERIFARVAQMRRDGDL